jgi:hypothetical protein
MATSLQLAFSMRYISYDYGAVRGGNLPITLKTGARF